MNKLLKELIKDKCTSQSDDMTGKLWIKNEKGKIIWRGDVYDLLKAVGAPCTVEWGM